MAGATMTCGETTRCGTQTTVLGPAVKQMIMIGGDVSLTAGVACLPGENHAAKKCPRSHNCPSPSSKYDGMPGIGNSRQQCAD